MGKTMIMENKIKLVTGVKGVEFSPCYTCVLYVHTVHLHKCLEISPTGTNPPYNTIF